MYRVAETMRPGVDMFDVAIIDEASQSGPEALLLTYLAKRLVVVGDSKQIAPDFIGIDRANVEELRRLHLKGIPHSDALGADGSFFDLAEIRYQGRVVLQEHFRCMPEIIQFSNNLCYAAQPLIPLRQYTAERLEPVVEAVHVSGGYREGSSSNAINRPEASAIVDRITEMTNDPAYKGKSIGVIALLGNTQPRLIEQMLLEQIGPETMEEFSIVCGNSYAFQGDERDVMFLSMVSAVTEGHRIGARTKAADERRFNVAASRARDQLVLYHSVTLNDLSSNCLQSRLLEYCMAPAIDPLTSDEVSIEHLKELARTVRRGDTKPPEPFDSWFEVDVYIRICDGGFRVIPQLEFNGYRIDLVVDGMRGRLAVECDGDYWHGPAQYQNDAARQRTLERCGWNFWRVRGSTFYMDPDAAMEDLWKELDLLGISTGQSEKVEFDATSSMPEISERTRSDHPPHLTSSENAQSELGALEDPDSQDSVSHALDETIERQELSPENRDFELQGASNPQGELDVNRSERLPDPRSTSKATVAVNLAKIVEKHGPIIVHHACRLYVRGAGFGRMGKDLRSALNKAMTQAIQDGVLEKDAEHGSAFFKNNVVRKKGTPSVVIRERGNRDFSEIPVSELAAVMTKLKSEGIDCSGTELYRKVLAIYDSSRLTAKVIERLKTAERSLDSQS
jgi:very-short-patch-repair endonuclease